jgi:hypothetical protein
MIHAVKFTSVIGPAIARFVALKQAITSIAASLP